MKTYWKWSAVFSFVATYAIAFAPGAAASAATIDSLVGAWAGQSALYVGTAKSRPMAVRLTLAETNGGASGTLQLGLPKRCTAQLKDAAQATNGSWALSVVGANGGSCDAFIGKMLKLDSPAKETLTFAAGSISGTLAPVASYRALAWNGDWSDSASASSSPVLRVHLDAAMPGDQVSIWRYGAPRSCSWSAEYSGNVGDALYFAFANTNGGYCDQLVGGYARLDASQDGAIHYGIYSPNGTLLKQGSLQRTGQ